VFSILKNGNFLVIFGAELFDGEEVDFPVLGIEDGDSLRLLGDADVTEAAAPGDAGGQEFAVERGSGFDEGGVIVGEGDGFGYVEVAVGPVEGERDGGGEGGGSGGVGGGGGRELIEGGVGASFKLAVLKMDGKRPGAELLGRGGIDKFEGPRGLFVVEVVFELPATGDGAAIGKFDAVERALDDQGRFGAGLGGGGEWRRLAGAGGGA